MLSLGITAPTVPPKTSEMPELTIESSVFRVVVSSKFRLLGLVLTSHEP